MAAKRERVSRCSIPFLAYNGLERWYVLHGSLWRGAAGGGWGGMGTLPGEDSQHRRVPAGPVAWTMVPGGKTTYAHNASIPPPPKLEKGQ